MSLHFRRALRAQLLAAVGLSCNKEGSDTGVHAPVVAVETVNDAGAIVVSAQPRTKARALCGADAAFGSFCGRSSPPSADVSPAPYEGCNATGDRMEGIGDTALFQPYTWKGEDYAGFVFDETRTAAYRHKLTTQAGSSYAGPKPLSATPLCCYSGCTPVAATRPAPLPPNARVAGQHCFRTPGERSSVPAAEAEACPAAIQAGSFVEPFTPGPGEGVCCYEEIQAQPVQRQIYYRGRAITEDGAPRMAAAIERTDWLERAPSESSDRGERWLHDAAMEHASVAAFSRLSLQLLALGAPSDLLADCHRAALDEIEHARLSYGMASAMLGRNVGPGKLVVSVGAITIEDLVRETVKDACVGETLATIEAFDALQRADGVEREILARIVDDETRHAALAFRIVRWAVDVHGESAAAAASEELARVRRPSDPLARAAFDDVITPCFAAILHEQGGDETARAGFF